MDPTPSPTQRWPRQLRPERLLAVACIVLAACSGDAPPDETLPDRGARLYRSYCVSCHHHDPRFEYSASGTHGPPLQGSSLDLVRMRVLARRYPPGSKPKRSTDLMPVFNLPEEDILALHAFLNVERDGNGR